MNKQLNNEIIYSLIVEDIQTVAREEIDKELSFDEIQLIKESIAKKINWYDAIADSIRELVAR